MSNAESDLIPPGSDGVCGLEEDFGAQIRLHASAGPNFFATADFLAGAPRWPPRALLWTLRGRTPGPEIFFYLIIPFRLRD